MMSYYFLLIITIYDLFPCSKNYSRYTMSCQNDTKWYPVALNGERVPFLTENTYYETNKSRVFENTENCIFGSGSKAGVIETNGYFPARPMEVWEGALVHIKIINNLRGAVAPTIHWHGFRMSDGYYWYDPLRMTHTYEWLIFRYDGVAGLTQCGIESKSNFTYSFIASEVGVRWWHGHSSGVKLDGLYGAIIGPALISYDIAHMIWILIWCDPHR